MVEVNIYGLLRLQYPKISSLDNLFQSTETNGSIIVLAGSDLPKLMKFIEHSMLFVKKYIGNHAG